MNMHLVGQLTDRFVPRTIGNRLHYLKNLVELRAVPRLDYETGNLKARSSVCLEDILGSPEADSAWKESRQKLDRFDVPDGSGGVNPGDRRAVFYLVKSLKPRSVLEIGTHIGASTLHVAAALHSNQAGTGDEAELVSVDIVDVNSPLTRQWLKYGSPHSPREMIEKLGFASFVTFVARKSLDYAATCGRKFDFIFLDGDHSAETVYKEVSMALKLLNPGGAILLHDYFPGLKPLWSNGAVVTGPFMATERLLKEGVNATVLPLGRLPWPTKLNSSHTSLALLLKNA